MTITGETYPEIDFQDLPTNHAAEVTVLGAMMLDNEAWKEISKSLSAEEFSLHSNQVIFTAMETLMNTDHAVDIVTLANYMASNKDNGERLIDAVGGVAYLASLTEGLPRRPVIKEYIEIVKEKARLRRIMGVCSMAIEKCTEQTWSAVEIVEFMGQGLKGIRKR